MESLEPELGTRERNHDLCRLWSGSRRSPSRDHSCPSKSEKDEDWGPRHRRAGNLPEEREGRFLSRRGIPMAQEKRSNTSVFKHGQESVQRPDAGVEAQFANKKAPKTYRCDSSIAPEMSSESAE